MLKLDHLAIGCADLTAGISWLSDRLEQPPLVQAKHQLFGTHNALWRLETDDYPVYLELIAIDPDAPKPARARWFGLDDPAVQARIIKRPALLTFIVSTQDFSRAREQMPLDPGAPVFVTRNNLKWHFSLHDDGRLVANGALPYLIAWEPGVRPVDNMVSQNIDLVGMGGQRLSELEMVFPCSTFSTPLGLEMALKLPGGKKITFFTGQ